MRIFWYSLLIATAFISSSASAADYEVRTFKQSQWFVYRDDLKTGLYINGLSNPQCYQIADILIFLDNKEQALDTELLQNAARQGLANYHAYCAAKNQQGSKIKNVVAFVDDSSSLDNSGRVRGDDILMSGKIVTVGDPFDGILKIYRNNVLKVQSSNDGQAKSVFDIRKKIVEDTKLIVAKKLASVNAIRDHFAQQFVQSKQSSKPTGFLSGLFSYPSEKLLGAWSSNIAQCNKEVLVLMDDNGTGKVEWWREFKNYGVLPLRSGSWKLEGDILTMVFNHHTEFAFMKGFQDSPMNQTLQFELFHISSEELHLAAPTPNSEVSKLLKADEKQFIRCLSD
ncbi:MAG: hypothetical protein COB24_12875 [Hyphomicrobiales bacterium]|nr:MAG: hypothetical protein COB24_12875 [Hyphomicrobiales bacterium]